jgi:hypothetical protein
VQTLAQRVARYELGPEREGEPSRRARGAGSNSLEDLMLMERMDENQMHEEIKRLIDENKRSLA